jgi:outer membrane protein OmpA-like peptidoglycan-associated protein
MNSLVLKYMPRILVLAFAVLIPIAMTAQDSAKPAVKTTTEDSASKWDIFVGYSFLSPHGTVYYGSSQQHTFNFQNIDYGGIMSISRYFNKYLGVQIEGDVHDESQDYPQGVNTSSANSNDDFSGVSAGVIYRYPTGNWTPFVHALGGVEITGGLINNGAETVGPVVTLGGGVDYATPLFNHHLAIRLFQADYQFIHPDYVDDSTKVNAARLSAGLVYHVGSIAPPPPVTISCAASPASVFPGNPVTVTATAGSLNPKLNVIYTWSGVGVTGNGTTVSVSTGSLAAGTYTVNCGVKEGKAGKEGLKPWEVANSSASFTVKAFEPPTISCAASPSTVKPGDSSTVTATGLSPQNRPLTYSYSAASGSVSGNGATATFNSTGAPTGPVAITCNVSDDKGQTATAGTSVTIVAPYVPPVPHTEALCTIGFDKDLKRPTRVDNEAKACLDEVALSLQKQSDAKAVVVGTSDAKEKDKLAKEEKAESRKKHPRPVQNLAAERAVNTKEYLVTEKGIDAARVSVATSSEDGQKVEDYLVPSGASFSADVSGSTPVDETAVKAVPRKPLAVRAHHAKKAK